MMGTVTLYLWLLLFYSCIYFCSASYSSAMGAVTLINKEQHVINMLKKLEQKLLSKEPLHVGAVQRYIKNFEGFFADNQTAEEIIQHPINYYHIFKHVTQGFIDLTNAYDQKKGIGKAYFLGVNLYRKANHFPTREDLETNAGSLARLQYMQGIPVNDMVDGLIRGKDGKELKSIYPLDSADCFLLGKEALHHEYIATSIEFLKAARELKEIEVFGADYKVMNNKLDEAVKLQNTVGNKEEDSIEHSVAGLCRGEDHENKTIDHSLVCRYITRSRPHLLIGPLKLEEVSRTPTVMMFHDFLNNWEVERFKAVATPELKPSKVYVANNVRGRLSFSRISEQAWLDDTRDFTLTKPVGHRIQDATGLNIAIDDPFDGVSRNSEAYQILNYGIGGLYLTHPDYIHGQDNYENEAWYRMSGDRMATMLIYLSDVELGGATVFPRVGLTVWPKRGAATFWYNLKKSIDPDPSTHHAGCPVIVGTKWISNKWIHVKNQHNYQCSLNREDYHDLLR